MKGKVKRKRPRKRNPARNMTGRQQGTESGRKQNPSNLLSFGPQKNLERQEFNRAQRKEVKQAMRWKGSC